MDHPPGGASAPARGSPARGRYRVCRDLEWQSGSPRDTVAGHAKPIIEKLDKKEKISKEEKENLSLFIAVLWTRVPDFDKSVTEFYDKINKATKGVAEMEVQKQGE